MVAKDGPLKSALDQLNSEGVIEHTLTTYRMRDGMLIKEEITRNYRTDGDYVDSITVKPMTGASSI